MQRGASSRQGGKGARPKLFRPGFFMNVVEMLSFGLPLL
jgi:hypothetical protein